MLAGAVVLHVGIGAFLGMWTFGLVMLIGCASFLPHGLALALAEKVFGHRAANEAVEADISLPGPIAMDSPTATAASLGTLMGNDATRSALGGQRE